MTVDYADWTDSQDRALKIYTKGVPLARKPNGVGSGSSAIAASGHATIATGTIDQPSFHMLIGLSYPDLLATIPFGQLQIQWTDSASGFTVAPDWVALIGGANLTLSFAYICGPARADTVTVKLFNLDPSEILSYSFGMSQTSHMYPRLRVQQVDRQTVPVFTNASFQTQYGVIGSVNTTVGTSSTLSRLMAAVNGRAIFNCDNVGNAVGVTVRLVDPGVIVPGGNLYGVAGSGIIASMGVGTANPVNTEVALPNGPVVLQVVNADATHTVQPMTTLTAIDL